MSMSTHLALNIYIYMCVCVCIQLQVKARPQLFKYIRIYLSIDLSIYEYLSNYLSMCLCVCVVTICTYAELLCAFLNLPACVDSPVFVLRGIV